MKKTTIVEIIRLLFIILFLYTGISKLTEYAIFKEQLALSPILAPVSTLVAIGLPWVEFLVVLMLIIPRWHLKGLIASMTLMILFTVYIIGILIFSEHIPCSCGGVLAELSWRQHILFNTVFIALAAAGIILEKQVRKNNKNELGNISNKNLAM